jgi:hypothetical protein
MGHPNLSGIRKLSDVLRPVQMRRWTIEVGTVDFNDWHLPGLQEYLSN